MNCGAPVTPENGAPGIPAPGGSFPPALAGGGPGYPEALGQPPVPQNPYMGPGGPLDQPMNRGNQPTLPPAGPAPKKPKAPKSGGSKVPVIILSIALGLFAVALGLGIFFYFKKSGEWDDEKASLETEKASLTSQLTTANSSLTNVKSELQSTKDALSSRDTEITNLKKEKQNLEVEIGDLQTRNADLQADLNKKGNAEASLSGFYTGIRGLNDPEKEYFASKNVVILRKGESEKVVVRCVSNTKMTLTFQTNNNYVTASWNKDWYDNNCSCTLNLTAGNSTGTTLVTMTNNINSYSFQIMAIVID
jgi:flagellar basal body-associated protein FliL